MKICHASEYYVACFAENRVILFSTSNVRRRIMTVFAKLSQQLLKLFTKSNPNPIHPNPNPSGTSIS